MTLAAIILAVLILLPPFAWLLYAALMLLAFIEDQLHPYVRWFARYVVRPFGLFVDVLVNIELSLAMFQSIPKAPLFTGTLKWWINNAPSGSRRERWAAAFCRHLLNPLDLRKLAQGKTHC